MDHTLSTIQAMRQQEESGYHCVDYFQQQHEAAKRNRPLHEAMSDQDDENIVTEQARAQMAAWNYGLCDFLNFSRETTEISMSLLDRYMAASSASALADLDTFQLAAMTCLYTAAKIHETSAMSLETISALSRGLYTADQVQAMEVKILSALQWRLNPPTSQAFLRHYLQLLPVSVLDANMRRTVYDLARYQAELAVAEYRFATVKSSTIAFCALMNALESVGMDAKGLAHISRGLMHAARLDSSCDDLIVILQLQTSLYEAVVRQQPDGAVAATKAAAAAGGSASTSIVAQMQQQPSSTRCSSPRSVTTRT